MGSQKKQTPLGQHRVRWARCSPREYHIYFRLPSRLDRASQLDLDLRQASQRGSLAAQTLLLLLGRLCHRRGST